jgi:hypothetical protein
VLRLSASAAVDYVAASTIDAACLLFTSHQAEETVRIGVGIVVHDISTKCENLQRNCCSFRVTLFTSTTKERPNAALRDKNPCAIMVYGTTIRQAIEGDHALFRGRLRSVLFARIGSSTTGAATLSRGVSGGVFSGGAVRRLSTIRTVLPVSSGMLKDPW